MRYYTTTWLALFAFAGAAQHGHGHGHSHHHRHRHASVEEPLEKRGGNCEFPKDAGLVEITPSMTNGGWALSPDQACEPGGYCPYACPPGQLSMQWDPDATSYSYPASMVGVTLMGEEKQWRRARSANRTRTVDSTATTTARSRSPSLTNPTARTAPAQWLPAASARRAGSLSVRPSCQGTRPC